MDQLVQKFIIVIFVLIFSSPKEKGRRSVRWCWEVVLLVVISIGKTWDVLSLIAHPLPLKLFMIIWLPPTQSQCSVVNMSTVKIPEHLSVMELSSGGANWAEPRGKPPDYWQTFPRTVWEEVSMNWTLGGHVGERLQGHCGQFVLVYSRYRQFALALKQKGFSMGSHFRGILFHIYSHCQSHCYYRNCLPNSIHAFNGRNVIGQCC